MRIDQSLHGYADGHRLLAGSIDLPRQEKYVMLGLSDMSGRTMVPGFEEYLTGYPLPDAGVYAFARTWYAAEMERPGCVWTHTLLISEKDIGGICDLGGLRRLFRRPTKVDKGGWEEYRTSLNHLEHGNVVDVTPWKEQHIACALFGLYSTDLPVFHPAEDARQLEDIMLALWSQQWPSLRFAFRFCTGAIGVRLTGNIPFDYQIIPPTSIREARREIPASIIVDTETWTNPKEWPVWLSIASQDLRKGGTSFRAFIDQHAGGEFDGRKAFAPLGELFVVWEQFSQSRTLPCLLDAIGERYPNLSEGISLKQAVAGSRFPLARSLVPGTSECDVLKAIATTAMWSAFDLEQLEIDRRTRTLWEKDRKSTEALIASLISADLNPLGEHVLLSLIKGMSIEDAVRNSFAVPGLVATAVRLNPDFAHSPVVWNGSPEHQRGLFDAATAAEHLSADAQRSIVAAMLQAGSEAIRKLILP